MQILDLGFCCCFDKSLVKTVAFTCGKSCRPCICVGRVNTNMFKMQPMFGTWQGNMVHNRAAANYCGVHADNQAFRSHSQEKPLECSHQVRRQDCSVTDALPEACPAPTEHHLSWSPAVHPPSVASSTLLDPEGELLLQCNVENLLQFAMHVLGR